MRGPVVNCFDNILICERTNRVLAAICHNCLAPGIVVVADFSQNKRVSAKREHLPAVRQPCHFRRVPINLPEYRVPVPGLPCPFVRNGYPLRAPLGPPRLPATRRYRSIHCCAAKQETADIIAGTFALEISHVRKLEEAMISCR